jgi:hypothetical protein
MLFQKIGYLRVAAKLVGQLHDPVTLVAGLAVPAGNVKSALPQLRFRQLIPDDGSRNAGERFRINLNRKSWNYYAIPIIDNCVGL